MPESHVFYYGDNLGVMREMGPDTVDLIYLDPPFNSERRYNVPLTEEDGSPSEAQQRAFADYWKWGPEAEKAYGQVAHPAGRRAHVPARLSQTMEMLRSIMGESDMLAYLSMMAVRLVEMRRLLKNTGSLYLHCDPTASHYIKLVLDALFGAERFRNEIIWKRTSGHSDAIGYGSVHDTILFYTKSDSATWNPQHVEYDEDYVEKYYRYSDKDGRRFMSDNLSAAGLSGGGYEYAWKGITRVWRCPVETMQRLDAAGEIFYTKNGIPRRKRYLDIAKGLPAQDIWTDIEPLRSWHREKTGYPTQKPLALVDRIIRASSKDGDVILEPFCGCGTAVVAAQNLSRKWIGIDVTHIAVSVLRRRLEEAFPDLSFKVYGEPEDVESARTLAHANPWEFQAWIVDKVGGMPTELPKNKREAKKGGDAGVDGWFLFRDDPKAARSKRFVLSVKSDASPGPEMVRELMGTVQAKGAIGGALLLLEEPTPGMRTTARTAGTFSSDTYAPGEPFNKIQILLASDLFNKKKILVPGWNSSHQSSAPRFRRLKQMK